MVDAVGDVDEFVGPHFREIWEEARAQKGGVDLGHTVHLLRKVEREKGNVCQWGVQILKGGGRGWCGVVVAGREYLVAADDGEVRHSDELGLGLLDDAHSLDSLRVVRPALPDLGQKLVVDIVDDLQMAREHLLKEGEGPDL